MEIMVKARRLDKGLPLPAYAYPGDAAFDLYTKVHVELSPGEKGEVPTGLALEIPEGYVGLVWDKSGIGIKRGVKTLGGVIDCGFRGELVVGMVNLSKEVQIFERGEKIAQMIIQKKERVILEEAEELTDSHRGERGFGSSGK